MGARSLLAVLLATACQAASSGHSGFGSTPDITTAASTGAGSTGVSSGSAGETTPSGSACCDPEKLRAG